MKTNPLPVIALGSSSALFLHTSRSNQRGEEGSRLEEPGEASSAAAGAASRSVA
jgi:hypothetical protein